MQPPTEQQHPALETAAQPETDARGHPVKILDPVAMHLLRPLKAIVAERQDVIPPVKLRAIAETLDSRWTRRGHAVAFMYVFGLAACYAGSLFYKRYISANPSIDLVGFLFYVGQFACMLAAFVFTWKYAGRARRPRICSVMLHYRCCPHCGYDIRNLPPDAEDGATICPECGCAWNLD